MTSPDTVHLGGRYWITPEGEAALQAIHERQFQWETRVFTRPRGRKTMTGHSVTVVHNRRLSDAEVLAEAERAVRYRKLRVVSVVLLSRPL